MNLWSRGWPARTEETPRRSSPHCGRWWPPAAATRHGCHRPLMDVGVHGQDNAIPLGMNRTMPIPAAVAAAERLWAMGFPFRARQSFRNISLHDRRAVCGRAGRAGHRADTGHRAGPGRPTRRAGRIVRKRPPHLLNAHERPAAEGVNDGALVVPHPVVRNPRAHRRRPGRADRVRGVLDQHQSRHRDALTPQRRLPRRAAAHHRRAPAAVDALPHARRPRGRRAGARIYTPIMASAGHESGCSTMGFRENGDDPHRPAPGGPADAARAPRSSMALAVAAQGLS
jgi:hypothetical protein